MRAYAKMSLLIVALILMVTLIEPNTQVSKLTPTKTDCTQGSN